MSFILVQHFVSRDIREVTYFAETSSYCWGSRFLIQICISLFLMLMLMLYTSTPFHSLLTSLHSPFTHLLQRHHNCRRTYRHRHIHSRLNRQCDIPCRQHRQRHVTRRQRDIRSRQHRYAYHGRDFWCGRDDRWGPAEVAGVPAGTGGGLEKVFALERCEYVGSNGRGRRLVG